MLNAFGGDSACGVPSNYERVFPAVSFPLSL